MSLGLANYLATRTNVRGRWWTLRFVRPADLDADGHHWTFWKRSQGAGIETRAAN